MSGIFGVVHLDGSPATETELQGMRAAMADWGPDSGGLWLHDAAGLGSVISFSTPEAVREHMPVELADGSVITGESRLDNRSELCAELGLPAVECRNVSDGHLIARAYERWQEGTPAHLLGDWSFAAWHPGERKLFLARDHFGNTAVYYVHDGRRFAFASSRTALFALGIPRRLNEFYLACGLVSWPAHHGAQTIELDLSRLPPAHTLTLDSGTVKTDQYWRLEDVPPLNLRTSRDYVEGFLSTYDRAVRDRLRSSRDIGVTLSGGLDSSSVTALAARALREQGRRLRAYTSVPIADVSNTVDGDRFGDELPFAETTAASADNIDLIQIRGVGYSPIKAIRHALEIHHEPGHAAGNLYWIFDLLSHARADGINTVLSGQGGNATISWTGADRPRALQRLAAQRQLGRLLQLLIYPFVPAAILRSGRHLLRGDRLDWSGTAINADFARRIGLAARYIDGTARRSNSESWNPAIEQRLAIIKPGESFLGSIWAENEAAFGLEVRDPTFDKRVMEFTLAIPDREFRGPDGYDRWIIRAAMKGLVPDEVRLNRRRGRQAADLGTRLVDSAAEVDQVLDELDASPSAREHLDLVRMRGVWRRLLQQIDARSTHHAVTILTRGIMAGLYLVGLEKAGP
jgi:asparagine synthase (glutamine-hydrolysing)